MNKKNKSNLCFIGLFWIGVKLIKYLTKQNQKSKTTAYRIFPIKISKYLVFLQKIISVEN
ncbi:hypothetical protein BOW55_03355 [Flavobacterium sp. YO12]|nr:hypothetical protein BOW55_03355 [Flavobacterium sp. YO12]